MKNLMKNWKALITVCLICGLCLAGCGGEVTDTATAYTEQTALAIIDAGMGICFTIMMAAIMLLIGGR